MGEKILKQSFRRYKNSGSKNREKNSFIRNGESNTTRQCTCCGERLSSACFNKNDSYCLSCIKKNKEIAEGNNLSERFKNNEMIKNNIKVNKHLQWSEPIKRNHGPDSIVIL